MSSETLAIETRQLVRQFGHRDAVNGLSLQVRPGRCYGFFGRNGAGKTTTIKCLLNLLHPTSGSVRILGLDPVVGCNRFSRHLMVVVLPAPLRPKKP